MIEKPEWLGFGETFGQGMSVEFNGDTPEISVRRQAMGGGGYPKTAGEQTCRIVYANHCRELAAWLNAAAEYMDKNE